MKQRLNACLRLCLAAALLGSLLLVSALAAGEGPVPTVDGTNIYANGAPIQLVAGDTTDYTNVLYDKDGSGTIEDTEYLKIGDDEPTAAGYDLYSYTIYGGSKDAAVTGSTSVTMTGGKITGVFGGGSVNDGTDVDGDTSVTINGGTVLTAAYGGGNGNGAVTGTAKVTILNGWVGSGNSISMVCGGGRGPVNNGSSVEITGGEVTALVFGGGYDTNGAVASSSVSVTGGAIFGALYGGGFQTDTTDTTSVSMTGGELMSIDTTFNGRIYAGNYSGTAAETQSVTLGGDAQAEGVVINGPGVANGVSFVTIGDDLSGTDPIPFILPDGFNANNKPDIAKSAVRGDLDKIKLAGSGAAGLEAYFYKRENTIAVRSRSVPEVDVTNKYIYAIFAKIQIVAGTTENHTNILYDKDGNGIIGDNEYLKIGAEDPTPAGYDLSEYTVCGAVYGNINNLGDTSVTMTGGRIGTLVGGTRAHTLLGNTSVAISGGTVTGDVYAGGGTDNMSGGNVDGDVFLTITGGTVEGNVYSGGYSGDVTGASSVTIADALVKGSVFSATLTNDGYARNHVQGGTTLTLGGGVRIGDGSATGVPVNDGGVQYGVDRIIISSPLSGGAGAVPLLLSRRFDPTRTPLLAAGAAADDLDHLVLAGPGAAELEAYYDDGETAIKAQPRFPHRDHDMSVDCGGSAPITFDQTLKEGEASYTINASGSYFLAADVDIGTIPLTITGAGTVVDLCLNGHTFTAKQDVQDYEVVRAIVVEDGARLNLCDCRPQADNPADIGGPFTGGLIKVLGFGSGAFDAVPAIQVAGPDSAFHMYGGTLGGSDVEDAVVDVAGGSFALYGGRIAYNNTYGCVVIGNGGRATIAGGIIEHDRTGYGSVFHNGASLTLSGRPVIRNNAGAAEGVERSIRLAEGKTITIGPDFAPQTPIGVVTDAQPTLSAPVAITGANSADHSGGFASVNEDYLVRNTAGNVVVLSTIAPPVITTASLSGGSAQTPYSQTLTATGTVPITWTLVSGDLPGGLTLREDGAITGTPNAVGTFPFTVQADNGISPNATKALSITVARNPGTEYPGYAAALTALQGVHIVTNVTPTLEDVALPEGWAFTGDKTVRLTAGSGDGGKQSFPVQYTPADPNYGPVTLTGSDALFPVSTVALNTGGGLGMETIPAGEQRELTGVTLEVTGAPLPLSGDYAVSSMAWSSSAPAVATVSGAVTTGEMTAAVSALQPGVTLAGVAYRDGDMLGYVLVKVTGGGETANRAQDIKEIAQALDRLIDPDHPSETDKAAVNAVADQVTRLSQADKEALIREDVEALAELKTQVGENAPGDTLDITIINTAEGEIPKPDRVEVVGASIACGVDSGSVVVTVKPIQPDGADVVLELELGLTVDGRDAPLKAPMFFQIDVPGGIDLSRLKLYHVKGGGARTELPFIPMGGRTIAFKLLSFSSVEFVVPAAPSDDDTSDDAPIYHSLTATAGAGGAIEPVGKVRVRQGGGKTFAITPDEGYEIADVLVDGKSVGAVRTYTFEKVRADHAIAATFRPADRRPVLGPFTDVREGDWFYDSVKYVYERGLMKGTGETTFSPGSPATRGMIVTILWRLEGEPERGAAMAFTDVETGSYCYEAVRWAAEHGVVTGYTAAAFGPDDPVTRQELSAILYRYARYKGADVSAVDDLGRFIDRPDPWAEEAVKWAVAAGIVTGKDGGVLDPGGTADRAQLAAMLTRFATLMAPQ